MFRRLILVIAAVGGASPSVAPAQPTSGGLVSIVGARVHAPDGRPLGGPLGRGATVDDVFGGRLAVVSRSQKTLVYVAYRRIGRLRVPYLYRRDLVSGEDRLMARGGFSPALSHGEAIAFQRRFPGRADGLFVKRRGDASPNLWLGSARVEPRAFAGRVLIAHRRVGRRGGAALAVYGPARSWTMAKSADLVAVGPGGDRVLLAVTPPGASTTRLVLTGLRPGSPRTFVEVASLVPSAAGRLFVVAPNGSWVGRRVVTSTTGGLLVLDVNAGRISFAGLIESPVLLRPGAFLLDDRDTVLGTYAAGAREGIVRCSIAGARCDAAEAEAPGVEVEWVVDPSR